MNTLETKRLAIKRLLKFLIELTNKWEDNDAVPFSPFYDTNNNALPEVRSVGKTLEEMGGQDLMLKVCKEIPRRHRRELEFAWVGIGSWQA